MSIQIKNPRDSGADTQWDQHNDMFNTRTFTVQVGIYKRPFLPNLPGHKPVICRCVVAPRRPCFLGYEVTRLSVCRYKEPS